MDTKSQRDITRKLKVLNYALTHKNVTKTCRHFSIGRATFYRWKTAYLVKGELGLIDSRPCPENQTFDDSTRIRALKIYEKHTQANAMDFINYVVEKFPFRIKMIRTDNGHEFQSKFNWHVLDLGMEHAYIKPGTPRLNGKVEHSHRTDKQKFYQLLD